MFSFTLYSTTSTSLYPTTDIDECDYEPCDDMSTCYNVNGSYFCACKEGYSQSGGSGESGESGASGGSGSYCEGEYMHTVVCLYMNNHMHRAQLEKKKKERSIKEREYRKDFYIHKV